MGQTSSSPLGSRGRRRSLRDSILKSPFPKRSHSQSKPTLSATCNFIDIDRKFDQLNVNTASEEELMTLPGINRSTARMIVEYRQAIGRFKKVEDLALVSGIGAEKLDLIRPEICVSNRRKNVSCASSRAQSFDSLPNTEAARSGIRGSPQGRLVNINSANVFDLMTIHSFNQELAANVVHHRERRGLFRTVDDLIKVKGINQWRLGALRSQVYVGDGTRSPDVSPLKVKGATLPSDGLLRTDSTLPAQNTNLLQVPNGKIPGHRKTMSVPIKYAPLTNGLLPNKDIFDLLSAYTQRPIVEEDFRNQRNGRPAVRVASWNLHDFSTDKVDNPGVRETVCRTILENRFSLIAVQEVVDNFALKKMCEELNYPTLRRVVDWRGEGEDWKYCATNTVSGHSLAFLYDANMMEPLTVEGISINGCESSIAVLARFQLADVTVCVLNAYVHDKTDAGIKQIHAALEGIVTETDFLVILGDFSGMSSTTDEGELDQLSAVMPRTTSTNSCNGFQEMRYYDNIYLTRDTLSQYTGVWGVVRQGLSHLAIPRGWMWGGLASEHCPVWCEIFTATKPNVIPNVVPNGVHLVGAK